jgi:hypothetical protein
MEGCGDFGSVLKAMGHLEYGRLDLIIRSHFLPARSAARPGRGYFFYGRRMPAEPPSSAPSRSSTARTSSTLPVQRSDTPTPNHRGINSTDWIRIDRAAYDACIDPRDYRV